MKSMLPYLKHYRGECVLGPLFKLLEAVLELFVPLVVKSIIDIGIAQGDKGYILRQCCLLGLLALVGLLFSVTAQYFAARAATGCSASLRQVLFSHLQRLSYGQIDRMGTSTMITRMTSDVNQVQSGVNLGLRLLLRSPFVVFGAMIMAFTVDAPAATIFAAVIPVLLVVVFGILLVTIPQYRNVQKELDSVTGAARENLTGVRVLRAFCREEEEKEGFSQKNRVLNGLQLKVGRISNLLNPATYVLLNLAVVALLWKGALRVDSGALTQGQVVALYNYMSQILVELVKFANLMITLTKATACGNRIAAILDIQPEMVSGQISLDEKAPGCVEFRQVSMAYHESGDEALTDVSFIARPGQTVGVIGGTGSGKSTLVNLIPRFYDVTGGSVLVDGVDVRDLELESLRSSIAVVPQRAVLFKGTIRSNLLWGKENATQEELDRALNLAHAMEVVTGKAEGLDAPVEQGGRNLSGGQKQRLTIARALVRQPKILILDDSASALDYATDAALRKAISTMENPPTTFIVSQRASSILHAHEIIVLEDGEVAGQGTHEKLLQSCSAYREIYESQFKREVAET